MRPFCCGLSALLRGRHAGDRMRGAGEQRAGPGPGPSAWFHESYRVKLVRPGLSIVEIFFALFGHTPFWMKALLITRNAIARRFGLEAPTSAEILHPTMRASYGVGDKIGPWPIYFIGEDEIVAGRNNKHLDFRLSVLRVRGCRCRERRRLDHLLGAQSRRKDLSVLHRAVSPLRREGADVECGGGEAVVGGAACALQRQDLGTGWGIADGNSPVVPGLLARPPKA